VAPDLTAHDLSHLGAYQAAARLVVDGEESAAPEDKAEVYRRLGLRLTYDPTRRVVTVESHLGPDGGRELSGGRRPGGGSGPGASSAGPVGESQCRRGNTRANPTPGADRRADHSSRLNWAFRGQRRSRVRSRREPGGPSRCRSSSRSDHTAPKPGWPARRGRATPRPTFPPLRLPPSPAAHVHLLVLALPTACDRLLKQIAGLLAELAARHGISSIQQVGMPPSSSSPPKKAGPTSIALHSKPKERSCSLSGWTPPLHARRVPIHSRCSRPLRLGEHPAGVRSPARRRSSPPGSQPVSWVPRPPAPRQGGFGPGLGDECARNPVLLSILERVVEQLGTDEEPEPSTLSLTAKSADHQTRSWWSTPAHDRLLRQRRTPIRWSADASGVRLRHGVRSAS